jgi:hypothetical protein
MLERTTPLIVRNSPIEFVVSGPLGGRDRVLIRSENAGLDIVALSSQSLEPEPRKPPYDPFLAFFGGSSRQLHVVSSMSVPDFRKDSDNRKSSLNFAWVGLASELRSQRIRDTFNRSLPDIFHALDSGTSEDVEFSIAPVILVCSEAHEQRRRSHRALIGILSIYGVIGLGLLFSTALKGQLPL